MTIADKRTAILQAVEEMVRDRRMHEVTLDQVAEAAHVGKGTIYRYFRNKEDMFFRLATHGHDELCDMIEECAFAGGTASFRKNLEHMCDRISEFFQGRRALMRVMGDHEERMRALHMKSREAFEQRRAKLRSSVAKVLATGIQTGEIRTDVPMETLAHVLLGMIRSRSRPFGHGLKEGPPVSTMVELFLNGAKEKLEK